MSKKYSDPWVRTFTVGDPVRHKKGYTLYKVTSKVFPKNSIEAVTQVTVWKRYNDFKKLHKALCSLHQNLYLKGTFPTFAKARFFGRFDDSVIEERRKCALELLEFTANHPPLFTSQVFVKFFEGGQVLDLPVEEEVVNSADNILQPIASPLRSNSNENATSTHCDNEEGESSLGGIWKHRQAADEISVSSHATEGDDEDDDRTTFTDDDPSKSTISDLSEFDPLSDINSSRTLSSTKAEDLCHDWLLSAFQSFASSNPEKNDNECILTFPKPFDGLEDLEVLSNDNANCFNTDTCVTMLQSKSSGSYHEFDPFYETQRDTSPSQSTNVSLLSSLDKVTTTDTLSTSSYILSAAKSVTAAQEAELSKHYFEAFTFYKAAIDTLLLGVKSEKNAEQAEAVQKKILQYLKRAEEIYETHLIESKREKKPVVVNVSEKVAYNEESQVSIQRTMKDLAKYRVIGILSKVLLVLDVVTNITCVVKVLRKSPEPQQPNARNIVPKNIDFIVQLYEIYETPDAIFLILEYASGGRLWDYISSYLQRSPLSPSHNFHLQCGKHEVKAELDNVYSGKKLQTGKDVKDDVISPVSDSFHSAVDELTAAEIYPSSYAALFRNYAANTSANNVSLAKCHIKLSVPVDFADVSFSENTPLSGSVNNAEEISPCLSKELQKDAEFDKNRNDYEESKSYIFKKNGISSNIKPCPSLENQVISNLYNSSTQLNCALNFNNCNISSDEKLLNQLDALHDSGTQLVAPVSNTDLPTFLSGDVGHIFINQNHEELSESGTISETKSIALCVSTHNLESSQQKSYFTEVFHHMDELSSASVKPTHLPESCIVLWTAEIVLALENLHKLGIIWKDLRPENILLGTEGHVLLSYQSQWSSVDHVISERAVQNFYSAPEVGNVFDVTSSCDWWSLGAILFELLSGRRLVSCYPSGITSHTSITLDGVSVEAQDLLQKLLKHNPSERLGSGLQGVEDIKCHPFFRSIDWISLRSY